MTCCCSGLHILVAVHSSARSFRLGGLFVRTRIYSGFYASWDLFAHIFDLVRSPMYHHVANCNLLISLYRVLQVNLAKWEIYLLQAPSFTKPSMLQSTGVRLRTTTLYGLCKKCPTIHRASYTARPKCYDTAFDYQSCPRSRTATLSSGSNELSSRQSPMLHLPSSKSSTIHYYVVSICSMSA